MRIVSLLEQIRLIWMDRVSHTLARGERVRESFLEQLTRFYDLLGQAITTGDPSWMNSVLDGWAEARTLTELEQQEASLFPLLNEIMATTHEDRDQVSLDVNSDSFCRTYKMISNIYSSCHIHVAMKHRNRRIESADEWWTEDPVPP